MDYIRAPFNYPGGKYATLNRLIPLFPDGIGTMVDLFGGSFSVGMNVKAEHVVYNDLNRDMFQLQKAFRTMKYGSIVGYVERKIGEWSLSGWDRTGFNGFRKHFNRNHAHPLDLYVLMCFSHNHQPRWNDKMQYNARHGANLEMWDMKLRKRLHTYTHFIEYRSVEFKNEDFREYDTKNLTGDDFIYLDPPYYLTGYPYNGMWSKSDEENLIRFINELEDKEIPYGISRIMSYNGYENKEFQDFINQKQTIEIHDIRDRNGLCEKYMTNKKI